MPEPRLTSEVRRVIFDLFLNPSPGLGRGNTLVMDHLEIKEHAVYTTQETQDLLKISESTIKRMLKKNLIRANKVGGQYRIMGKEILRLVSPSLEQQAVKSYLKIKKKVIDKINPW